MAEHRNESNETQPKRQSLLPAWVKGVVWAEIFWGLMCFGAYAADAFDSSYPEWFRNLDLPDTLGTICGVLAFPIALGGWLFIWGDGPQPPNWITSLPFNIGFGLIFYGLIGALVGRWIGKLRHR